MPSFDDTAVSTAPVEEVWKILYDPSRMAEWWSGIEAVTPSQDPDTVTFFPDGYPDFPMPQQIDARSDQRRMVVSCQVSDLVFEWILEPIEGRDTTRISVHVEIPAAEAFRLDAQREAIGASIRSLAVLAGRSLTQT